MDFSLDELDINALKRGYLFYPALSRYTCLTCGACFEQGEVYPFGGRFFQADRAVQLHVQQAHGDRFAQLVSDTGKYVPLTDHQRELLHLIRVGLSDQEIAAKLGVSTSTVRHQRFVFREKAKQAKMYLAIYELAIEKSPAERDAFLPVHSGAHMVDDRYATTQEEGRRILQNAFASLEPLKLKVFPVKEKKKIVVLAKICAQFEKDRTYSEKEVNQVLKEIFADYATLRRYLIEYGFMQRTRDCKEYRRT